MRDLLYNLFHKSGNHDDGSEGPEGDSCMPGFNVTDEPLVPPDFAPDQFRIKLLVAGEPRESKNTAKVLMNVQNRLAEQIESDFPDTKLLMSVGTFLDGCRHDTGWSNDPADILSRSTEWHCYQTETQFSEAFESMLKDKNNSVDVIIMVGNRFDDDPKKVANIAQKLHEKNGTRVFAMPTTEEHKTRKDYTLVAENAGGLALPHMSGNSYSELVKAIVQTSLFKSAGMTLAALPNPESKEMEEVRLKLEKL